MESLSQIKHTLIGRLGESHIEAVAEIFSVGNKTVHPQANHAQSFLKNLFKTTPDGHHFTDRFHTAAQLMRYTVEFTQIPTGNFTNDIIKCWFKKSGCIFGNRIFQFGESITQAKFGGNKSQWITCGF